MRLENTSNISSSTEGAGAFISNPRMGYVLGVGRTECNNVVWDSQLATWIQDRLGQVWVVRAQKDPGRLSLLNVSLLESSGYQLLHTHRALDGFLSLEWSVYVGREGWARQCWLSWFLQECYSQLGKNVQRKWLRRTTRQCLQTSYLLMKLPSYT